MKRQVSGNGPRNVELPDHLERTCLLIAGMHRSGTSALTRVLSLLGADLPKTLMEGSDANKASNAQGHWESLAASRLGDLILDSAGIDWRSPEPVAASWYSSARYPEMRDRAVDMLHEEFGHSSLFAFKDPRVCKLMPFWLDAIDRAGAKAHIVSISRNPLEVAASLHVRNGMEPMLSELLWLSYVLDTEHGSRGASRCFVRYDNLLENPKSVIGNITDSFGIAWPRQSTQVNASIASFLSPELYHQKRETRRSTGSDTTVAALINEVETVMRRWSARGESPLDHERLDECRAAFESAMLVLGEPIRLAIDQGARLRHLRRRDKELEEKLAAAVARADAARKGQADDRPETKALQLINASLREERDSLARRLDEASQSLLGAVERLSALNCATEDVAKARESFDARLDEERRRAERVIAEAHALAHAVQHEAVATRIASDTRLDEERRRSEKLIAQNIDLSSSAQTELTRVRQELGARLDKERDKANSNANALLLLRHQQTATETRLADLIAKLADSEKMVAQQIAIAGQRQAAIVRLRLDRAEKVAQRDTTNQKLVKKIERLEAELVLLQQSPPPNRAVPILERIAMIFRSLKLQQINKRAERLFLLRNSSLFDAQWYLDRYEDVKLQRLDPAVHYLDFGGIEGRWPSKHFNGHWYLETYQDVRDAQANPLLHYIEHGQLEGREIRSLAETKQRGGLTEARHLPSPGLVPPAKKDSRFAAPAEAGHGTAELRGQNKRWVARKLPFWMLAAAIDSEAIARNLPQLTAGGHTAIASAGLAWFKALGNFAPSNSAELPQESLDDALRMTLHGNTLKVADAWFTSPGHLLIRLQFMTGIGLLSAACYQQDGNGSTNLCGFAPLVDASTLILAAKLDSPFRPILLVIRNDKHTVIDCTIIPYPSLLRGGAHYAEAVALDRTAPPLQTGIALGRRLVEKYLSASSGVDPFAISRIEMNLAGANGTEPGLSSDLLDWLTYDLGIKVTAIANELPDDSEIALLGNFAASRPSDVLRQPSAGLKIGPNSTPSLASIFALSSDLGQTGWSMLQIDPAVGLPIHHIIGGALLAEALAWQFASLDSPPHITGSEPGTGLLTGVLALSRSTARGNQSHLVPLGARTPMPFPAPSGANLSVLIDCPGDVADLVPLIMSINAMASDFALDVTLILGDRSDGPAQAVLEACVPLGLVGKIVSTDATTRIGRFRACATHARSDRLLLMGEDVILHDRRIGAALNAVCDSAGVGAATPALVSVNPSDKNRDVVCKTAGWIGAATAISDKLPYLMDVAGLILPATFQIYAPDLRCTMIDRAHLLKHDEAASDLALGLDLWRNGLASIAIACITASAGYSAAKPMDEEPAELPFGVLSTERLAQ